MAELRVPSSQGDSHDPRGNEPRLSAFPSLELDLCGLQADFGRTESLELEEELEEEEEEDVTALLMGLGMNERESLEIFDEAMAYFEEKRPENLPSGSVEDGNETLLYLMDRCVPARDLAPMFALFQELQIQGTLFPYADVLLWGGVGVGRSLTKLCVAEPRILLDGDPESIRHVMYAFRRLGIHESQVHKLIGACPSILMTSVENFTEAMVQVSQLFASEEDLILFLNWCPQIILDSSRRFEAVHNVLGGVGMTRDETLRCVRKVPKLLLRDPKKLTLVRDWFIESGLTMTELKSMLLAYPQLLHRRLSVLKEKKKFLVSVAGRPFRDVLTFPNYFHYAIDRTTGPRFTFLRERKNPALHTASLDDLLRPTNQDFARKVAKVLEAEYVVYQAQWTRMYGSQFEFLGRPKKENTYA